MRKWVDELFIIIMDMLQDSSLLAKRQVSTPLPLWTGQAHEARDLCHLSVPKQWLAHSGYLETFVDLVKRKKTWNRISCHPDPELLSVLELTSAVSSRQKKKLQITRQSSSLLKGKRVPWPLAVEANRAPAHPPQPWFHFGHWDH